MKFRLPAGFNDQYRRGVVMLRAERALLNLVYCLGVLVISSMTITNPAVSVELKASKPAFTLVANQSCEAACRSKVNQCKEACRGQGVFGSECRKKCDQEKAACYKRC